MDTRTAFVADVQPAVAVEPRQRAFDDPARAAEPAPMGRPTFGELRANATSVELIPMGLGIVAPVTLEQPGFAPRTARTGL